MLWPPCPLTCKMSEVLWTVVPKLVRAWEFPGDLWSELSSVGVGFCLWGGVCLFSTSFHCGSDMQARLEIWSSLVSLGFCVWEQPPEGPGGAELGARAKDGPSGPTEASASQAGLGADMPFRTIPPSAQQAAGAWQHWEGGGVGGILLNPVGYLRPPP